MRTTFLQLLLIFLFGNSFQLPTLFSQGMEISTEDNLVLGLTSDDCYSQEVTLSSIGSSDASCGLSKLEWKIEIDFYDDGITDLVYDSSNPSIINGDPNPFYISPTLDQESIGVFISDCPIEYTHKVIWSLKDSCSNSVTLSTSFKIVDSIAPTPYCLNLGNIELNAAGVEVKAIDYNQHSFDNCIHDEELRFTFNEVLPPPRCDEQYSDTGDWYDGSYWYYDSDNAEMNADCHDELEGAYRYEVDYGDQVHKWDPALRSSSRILTNDDVDASGFIELPIYVWDKNDNYNFCLVYLRVIVSCFPLDFYYVADDIDPNRISFFNDQEWNTGKTNWTFGDGGFSQEQNPIHRYDSAGVYEVCLEVEGHSVCKNVTIAETSSIRIEKENQIKIHPNPVSNNLIVELETAPVDVRLSVYSVDGTEVRSMLLTGQKNTIDISALPEGLYFYKVAIQRALITHGSLIKQ